MITPETRYKKGRPSKVDRTSNHLISLAQVAYRWDTTPGCARRRLEAGGVPILRFNRTTAQVWLSDLIAIEKKVSSTPGQQPENQPDAFSAARKSES